MGFDVGFIIYVKGLSCCHSLLFVCSSMAFVIKMEFDLLSASIAQMSRLYTRIWNEMTALKQKVTEELHSGPFIFVPYTSGSRHEDMVTGVFMSSEEVYWHDATGTADLIKKMQPQCNSIGTTMLCDVYPGLHEFFVKICGVSEIPSLRSYLQILLQVSSVSLPSQAAHAVSIIIF